MSDRVWLVLVVVMVVGVALLLFWGNESNPPKPNPVDLQPLGILDEDWSVTGLDGKEIRMGDVRGNVLFINHWSLGCPPCIQEMPTIQRLYESLKGSGVKFLIFTRDPVANVRQAVVKRRWLMPIYVSMEPIPPVLRTRYIPATFIVNRKGEVVFREEGMRDWNTDEIRALLKKI